MNIGDRVKFKRTKNGLQFWYGFILGFKQDKIQVSKYSYSDFSGNYTSTWIEKKDLVDFIE
jgi:hypothetical protein